jgi:NAD(P)H-hydrate epimerase
VPLVVTPAQMGELDRKTIAAGTPESVLVERAGSAVAWAARRMLGGTYGRRVVIACGKGNNGADGRVAARVLRGWGASVAVVDVSAAFEHEPVARELARCDLFVDAMFGTGFRGALDGDPAWLAEQATRVASVLAVDIPSGVDGSTGAARGAVVRADATVTFAYLKPGLLFEPGRTHAGAVEVADIGIRADDPHAAIATVTTADDARRALGARAPDEHKWRAAVLVVGGSSGMIGAPWMTARAAMRTGSGMVVAAVPGHEAAARVGGGEVVARAMSATKSGALTADAADELLKGDLERFKAIAIGPGIGRAPETAAAVARIVADAPVPIVIDADALTLLAENPEPLRARRAPAVVTPHDGEYARLAGHAVGDDRIAAASELARDFGVVVLLKGPATVVVDPHGGVAINPTGTPALATAGTGDVLTGIVAALLARGAAPFDAAAAAAFVHGRAAEIAGTAPGLVAGDVIDALPPTLRVLTDPRED